MSVIESLDPRARFAWCDVRAGMCDYRRSSVSERAAMGRWYTVAMKFGADYATGWVAQSLATSVSELARRVSNVIYETTMEDDAR